MYQEKIIIELPHGLHTRPAFHLVKKAQKFSSDVYILKNDRRADATSILSILMLEITCGQEITIEGEEKAVKGLIRTIRKLNEKMI